MKNQYFGDINDYKKYSLLRLLSGKGQIETAVCWVLTEDDSGTDGKRIAYLEKPEIWQKYDPEVYQHLKEHVIDQGVRNVNSLKYHRILPNCRYYGDIIRDDIKSRDLFFKKFLKFAKGVDLVFFDPDNGLEVKSVPRGKKKSSKYIYWNEVEVSYKSGHSLLLYQHFPRMSREVFICGLVQRFKELKGIKSIYSCCTYHVAFLLIPQPHHEELFRKNTTQVSRNWGDIIRVQKYCIA
jgi:hypothetical protein